MITGRSKCHEQSAAIKLLTRWKSLTSAQDFVLQGSDTSSMKVGINPLLSLMCLTSISQLMLFCLLPLALASPEADPTYGHGYHKQRHLAPKCRTVYDTVTSSACTTVTDTACTTKVITSTKTETRQECNTVTEQQCTNTVRDVAEEQCATTTETECNDFVRQVPEQVCETVEDEVCHDEAQCTTEQQCQDITVGGGVRQSHRVILTL